MPVPQPSFLKPSALPAGAAATLRWAMVFAAGALLGGCAGLRSDTELLEALTPYKIEIVQGNVVTREQAALVKPGLTREQVREVLGAPMLTDLFHANRWDYPFTIHRGGQDIERRVVTVLFNGDVVQELKAPELPTEREFVAARSNFKPSGKPAAPLELTEAQRRALPAPVRSAADARPEPQGAARSYPPLEAR